MDDQVLVEGCAPKYRFMFRDSDPPRTLIDPETITVIAQPERGAILTYNKADLIRVQQGIYERNISHDEGGNWVIHVQSTNPKTVSQLPVKIAYSLLRV